MKKTVMIVAISLFIISISATTGFGHIISIEGQAYYKIPWHAPENEDFSFVNPFMVTRFVLDPDGNELYVGPAESQAVSAYLTKNDFDVYQVNVTPMDIPEFGPPLIISASALPPACQQTRNNYPATALLGPIIAGFPEPTPDLDLPFEIPPGYGIIIAENPELGKKEQRPIFNIDLADPELELGLSWFLPLGLTQDCLLYQPWLCNYENTISQPIFVPGVYYIVMWDPNGKRQDYTANIGFLEEVSEVIDQTEMQELVKDNALLHRPCREPYPWDR
jgi:hypothetical protein